MDLPITHVEAKEVAIPVSTITPSNLPPGWWNLDLEGSREGVSNAIAKAASVPEFWKAVLQAELAALAPQFNYVEVDAHCHVEKGRTNFHLTITPTASL